MTDSVKQSWAEQVEQGEEVDYSSKDVLPAGYEEYDEVNNIKKVTEFKFNEDGKKVKIVKTYRVEKIKVSKSIARRKSLKKFGAASGDRPGPNTANTIISEDVFMQFVNAREQQQEQDDDPLSRLKSSQKILCRVCKGDHWTTKCPYKDSLAPLQDSLGADKKVEEPAAQSQMPQKPGKYILPNLREGGNRRGESLQDRKRDDSATIRVTNLSEDTRESDLQELFKPFGTILRIFLAKDKVTGQSKGFAFINFSRKEEAARAIAGVSGYGYDHLILNVEWAKPSGNN